MKSDIKTIISTYLKYYKNEENELKQLIEFINESSKNEKNIFSSTNSDGHITASGFIYAKKEKSLLLLEHKKLGMLLQPGGHVEEIDNTLIDSAKREILEETGLKDLELLNLFIDREVPFDINTHFIPENKKMSEHYHHDFRYLFTVEKESDIKIDLNESKDYKWVKVEELKDVDRFKIILKKINRDFQI